MLIIFIEALGMLFMPCQVAIEFGLCETLNTMAIKSDVLPKDGKFDFKFSDLEATFPEGTFDHNVEMAYKEVLSLQHSYRRFLLNLFFISLTIFSTILCWLCLVSTVGRICGRL